MEFDPYSDYSKFLRLLSPKRLKGLNTENISLNKKAGILGEVILQNVAKTFKGILGEFDYGQHGKPFFKNLVNLCFNVSHSENLVAVAFCEKSVGVDIELLRDVDLKISERFFHENEKLFVKDNKTFLKIWTRKEAYIKYTGSGLSTPLSSFDSFDNPLIKTFENNRFSLSVCCENPEKFEILYITENDLKL